MNENSKNECRCEKKGCGCAEAASSGCQCGTACNCAPACQCGNGCKCATPRAS